MDQESWKVWLPSIVSIVTLIVNISFYIFVQPKISFTLKRKERFVAVTEELLEFLSEVVSKESFDGVPTKIRNYSLKLHLCFKSGEAPQLLNVQLEHLFKMCQERKKLTDESNIRQWNEDFRNEVRQLRKAAAEYCGVF